MIDLNLLQYKDLLEVKKADGKTLLFDPLRKKWLVLQPEELVRQLVIQFLIKEKGYNITRIKLEKVLNVNNLNKRCDVLVYDRNVRPYLLVECKAPHVDITQDTFRQIASYNLPLRVPYLLVVNGLVAYCCEMDYEENKYEFLADVPAFSG